MSNVLYAAPSRDTNDAGPREFAYLAEVDILGWKFRLMKDGKFVIDTPNIVEGMEGSNMLAVLGRDHADLLAALLNLDPDLPEVVVPDRWTNVGRLVS
jgi:hypothetical protein